MATRIDLDAPAPPMAGETDLSRIVRQTERLSGLVAVIVVVAVPGLSLVRHLLRGEPLLGLANALLLGLFAVAIIALVEIMILGPLATLRYRAATRALRAEFDRLQRNPLARWQAFAGPPAMLAIARDGHVLLADASTGFVPIRLRSDAILSVEAVLATEASRVARAGLSVGIGVPVCAGLVVAPLSAPARPKTGRTRHTVALGYRLGRDGAARTTRLRCRDAGDAQCLALALREMPPVAARETAARR